MPLDPQGWLGHEPSVGVPYPTISTRPGSPAAIDSDRAEILTHGNGAVSICIERSAECNRRSTRGRRHLAEGLAGCKRRGDSARISIGKAHNHDGIIIAVRVRPTGNIPG